jgi:hypothetical protein
MYFDMVFKPSMKRFVLVEFMPDPSNKFADWINGFLLRRTAKRIQVLTKWEKEQYARRFNLPLDVFHYIPWWLSANGDKPGSEETIGVVSSGRSGCDWNTLFRAANGRDWALTVICSKSDMNCVSKLNSRKRARVLCEIPTALHDQYVASATVYVLSVIDMHRSCGQVRLCHATTLGTPVVATKIRGIEDYCIDGETTLLVDPEDYLGMRDAIEKLLSDRNERNRLRFNASKWSKQRTYQHYSADITEFVLT